MSNIDFPDQNVPVPSHAAGSPALQSERMLLVRQASPTNNLRDYLSIFFKHKTSIIVAFVVISIIGIALAFVYKKWIYEPKFEARSSLLVKTGWENYSPDLSLEKRQGSPVNQADVLGSEISILQSRELKEKVISSLKPGNIFPQLAKAPYEGHSNNDAALALMEKHLVVSPEKRGNIIDVVFDGNDPSRLAPVVNLLVSYYIDKRTDIYKDPKAVLFLEKKADEYRQKLLESEDRLKAFRQETKIVSFDEERDMLLKRRSDLAGTLTATANGIKEIEEKIAEFEKQLASIPKTATTATAYDMTKDAGGKLLNLQLQEQELVAKYKEDNRLIANIRAQIAMVKEYLEKNSANAKPGAAPADPVYQDVQKQILSNKVELGASKIRYAALEKELGELNAQIQAFEALGNRYKELTRDLSANEENYRGYRQKLEEARIYDELDRQKMTSVSVLEPAGVPIAPVNPPKPFILLIAAAIGAAILGSFGIAYMRELAKQVMSTAMEVERKLDLPVLITIPIRN